MRAPFAAFGPGLLLASLLCCAPARSQAAAAHGPAQVLPWIADDYPRALALAKQRHVPIFVENWAPW